MKDKNNSWIQDLSDISLLNSLLTTGFILIFIFLLMLFFDVFCIEFLILFIIVMVYALYLYVKLEYKHNPKTKWNKFRGKKNHTKQILGETEKLDENKEYMKKGGKRCNQCGATNTDYAIRCRACGSKLASKENMEN